MPKEENQKNKILKGYREYLRKNKEIGKNTLNSKISVAMVFLNHINSRNTMLKDLGREEIERYALGIKSETALYNFREFCEYLEKKNLLSFSNNSFTNTDNQSIHFSNLLSRYLDYNRQKGLSERSIAIVGSKINRFLDYLKDNNVTDISRVNEKILSEYSLYLLTYKTKQGKNYNVFTRCQILMSVRNFFRHLKREEILLLDPSENIELPKLPKKITREITVRDIDDLLKQIDTNTTRGLMEYALIETIFGTGVRAGEVIHLKIRNVDFEKRFLTIEHGKGKKDRVTPINTTALNWIDAYLKTRKKTDKEEFLFTNSKGNMLTTKNLTTILHKYTKLAGIRKRIIPHSLRYACATNMLRNGADIRYIQEMLGHDSLSTTQKYTLVEKKDLKRMIENFHPREVDDESADEE